MVTTSIPPPRKIVTYPISGDENGGALYIYGDPASKRLAIMSAGFPDDQSVCCPFASRLAKETDTLVGVTCLPGFDDREDKPWTDHKKGGYTLDEMVQAFREAVKTLRSESSAAERAELVGIFHDWGVIPGVMWCNRSIADADADADAVESSPLVAIDAPDKMVLFDLCASPHRDMKDRPEKVKPSFRETFIKGFYMFSLAFIHITYRHLGNVIAYPVATVLMTIMSVFRIFPTLPIDDSCADFKLVPRLFYRCYPYYQMLKSAFTGRMEDFQGLCLPKDLEKTPLLFMYGMEKRIQFISDYSALTVLEREHREGRSKSNAIAVEGAGHWLYHENQKFDFCFDQVKNFIE